MFAPVQGLQSLRSKEKSKKSQEGWTESKTSSRLPKAGLADWGEIGGVS